MSLRVTVWPCRSVTLPQVSSERLERFGLTPGSHLCQLGGKALSHISRLPLAQAGVELRSADSAKPSQAPAKHVRSRVPANSLFSLPIFSAKPFIEEKGYVSRAQRSGSPLENPLSAARGLCGALSSPCPGFDWSRVSWSCHPQKLIVSFLRPSQELTASCCTG